MQNQANMNKKEKKVRQKFDEISERETPKSNMLNHCVWAFVVGGLICVIGQIFYNIFKNMGIPKEDLQSYVSIVMIFIGAFLTGIGIYDKIGEFAGAGSVVPITGFSNSIVSPAMEFKKEGYVFGIGAKMFTVAGPVLVYGIGSSVIVGLIYYLIKIIGK